MAAITVCLTVHRDSHHVCPERLRPQLSNRTTFQVKLQTKPLQTHIDRNENQCKLISQIVPWHGGFSFNLADVTHENENKSPMLEVCDMLIHSSDL